jgi:glucan 1,3-beta-glucosidase
MVFKHIIGAAFFLAGIVAAQDNVFEKDPRLHQSFYGIAYTPPFATDLPACRDTLENVVKDIQLLSQLTTRIRLYGSDCRTADLVLEAINRTEVNMEVFLGIFLEAPATVSPANVELVYNRMMDANIAAIQKWGTRNVAGLTVGNEYILVQIQAGEAQATAEQFVVAKMADARAKLRALALDKPIPVGTADAGGLITRTLSEGSDYVFANVHSFFAAGVTIANAATWTVDNLLNNEPASALTASNKPTLYSAEVGWPTATDNDTTSAAGHVPSLANTQKLLDDFICTANAVPENGANGYFWFEFADAAWKTDRGGVEPHWGLFDKDHVLKNLTIPTCLANAAVLPPLPRSSNTATATASQTATGTGTTTAGVRPTNSPGAAMSNQVASTFSFVALVASIGSLLI